MIQPTVGRIVLFRNNRQLPSVPAIITCVHNDRLVNLTVFDVNGATFGATSVRLSQPEDEVDPSTTYCEWMPYQVKKPTGSESGERAAGTQVV